MKKNIIIGITGAIALFSFASCNPDRLNIPQKGVVAYEGYYGSNESAEAALTAVYAQFIALLNDQGGINNPGWNVIINACGDELYWGGGKKDGSSSGAQDMNEFRKTYDSNVAHLKTVYKALYSLIHKCNLVIDNFYGEDGSLCDTAIKKRCVAEARVFRAWAHFNLACYWGTPPLVDHVLPGDAHPTNCDHQELMDWIIAEYKLALPDLKPRNGKEDKPGAWKITTGNCLAFLGKAQIFNKDWEGAKESLDQVIKSGNYDLTPTSKIWALFHMECDGNEEKVLEANYVYDESFGKYGAGKFSYQRNEAMFFRNIKKYPSVLLNFNSDGWGNNCAPTQKFMDAIMAHEPNSARRKAWFVSYEEFLTEYEYPLKADAENKPTMVPDENGDTHPVYFKADADMTKEEKLMDFRRGLNCEKYDETYANCGYFFMKTKPWQSDVIPNRPKVTQENLIVMRFAEVLLLYAEACAQLGETSGEGLEALNRVAERAGAPLYSELNMANVKQEKWFEMAWEGTRFLDLVRWGDAAKELAFKTEDKVPYLHDDFYVHGSNGKKTTGRPHKAVIYPHDDGWAALGGGFKAGKHELYPFPYDVVLLNPWNEEKGEGLKQNPGWD